MPTDSKSTIELLTPEELADLLKISKAGVYRLVAKRSLHFYKVGGGIRFAKVDVMTFLQRSRVESVGSNNYGSAKH